MKDFFDFQDGPKIKISILFLVLICSMYYFFKNYKTLDFQPKLLLCIAILGSIWLFFQEKEENKDFNNLKNNFALTTGKIEKYIVVNLKGYKGNPGNSIKFKYVCNNETIENSYYESYIVSIPDAKPDLNISYLVIYEKSNPKNSYILLNYPIKNSDDFENYKNMFRDKIPEDVFKNSLSK